MGPTRNFPNIESALYWNFTEKLDDPEVGNAPETIEVRQRGHDEKYKLETGLKGELNGIEVSVARYKKLTDSNEGRKNVVRIETQHAASVVDSDGDLLRVRTYTNQGTKKSTYTIPWDRPPGRSWEMRVFDNTKEFVRGNISYTNLKQLSEKVRLRTVRSLWPYLEVTSVPESSRG